MSQIGSPSREDLAIARFYDAVHSGASIEAALAESVLLFPEAADLLTMAAAAQESNVLPSDELLQHTSKRIHASAAARRPGPLASLLGKMTRLRLDFTAAVRQLQIGMSIMQKLEQRMIDPTTLPNELMIRLADLLDEPLDRVAEYLSLPAKLSRGNFNSTVQPKAGAKQTFREALDTSLVSDALASTDYRFWLASIDSREGGNGD